MSEELPQSRPPANDTENAVSVSRIVEARMTMADLSEYARARLAGGGTEQEQFLDVAFLAIERLTVDESSAAVFARSMSVAAAGAIMLAERPGVAECSVCRQAPGDDCEHFMAR